MPRFTKNAETFAIFARWLWPVIKSCQKKSANRIGSTGAAPGGVLLPMPTPTEDSSLFDTLTSFSCAAACPRAGRHKICHRRADLLRAGFFDKMNAVYRDFRFSSARRDKTLGSCRRLLDEIKLKAEERLFVPDQKIRTALK